MQTPRALKKTQNNSPPIVFPRFAAETPPTCAVVFLSAIYSRRFSSLFLCGSLVSTHPHCERRTSRRRIKLEKVASFFLPDVQPWLSVHQLKVSKSRPVASGIVCSFFSVEKTASAVRITETKFMLPRVPADGDAWLRFFMKCTGRFHRIVFFFATILFCCQHWIVPPENLIFGTDSKFKFSDFSTESIC